MFPEKSLGGTANRSMPNYLYYRDSRARTPPAATGKRERAVARSRLAGSTLQAAADFITMLRRTLLSTALIGPSPVRGKSLLLASCQLTTLQLVPPTSRRRRNTTSDALGSTGAAPMSSSSAADSAAEKKKDVRDTIIIGSGPAGYTAGIHLDNHDSPTRRLRAWRAREATC